MIDVIHLDRCYDEKDSGINGIKHVWSTLYIWTGASYEKDSGINGIKHVISSSEK